MPSLVLFDFRVAEEDPDPQGRLGIYVTLTMRYALTPLTGCTGQDQLSQEILTGYLQGEEYVRVSTELWEALQQSPVQLSCSACGSSASLVLTRGVVSLLLEMTEDYIKALPEIRRMENELLN